MSTYYLPLNGQPGQFDEVTEELFSQRSQAVILNDEGSMMQPRYEDGYVIKGDGGKIEISLPYAN